MAGSHSLAFKNRPGRA